MIKKIESIKGLGLFKGNTSFPDNIDFEKYNIIYGYNGSGKTSLSRALRFLEDKKFPEFISNNTSNVELSITTTAGKQELSLNNIKDCTENIRVFNTDFVWENIKWSENGAKGIATIGKEHEASVKELKKKETRKEEKKN